MIPCNSADESDIRLIQMKFRSQIGWRRQVFIAFNNHEIIFFRQMHHIVKSLQLRTHQVIHCNIMVIHHMQYHGSYGRFSVRTANNHTGFSFGMFIYKLRIRINFQAKFLCFFQFRIISFGMHTQYYCINIVGDFFRKPAHRLW